MISIILPTYNGAQFIKSAIKSVLEQSLNDFELLVIDDGSTDNTADIVKSISRSDSRVHYLRNEKNLGIQKTLNRGIKEAQGEYIARIDDDDEWIDKDKLKEQMEFLNTHTDHVLVGTGTVVVDEQGKEMMRYLLPNRDEEIRKRLLGKNCFVHSSVLFKKNAVLQAGGYNESMATRHVEDYDLWLKLGAIGKLANLPLYAVKFMLRSGNISSRNKIEQFKKDIWLTKKHRNSYPNFLLALLRGYLRLIFYGVFCSIPLEAIRNKIFKIYKEY